MHRAGALQCRCRARLSRGNTGQRVDVSMQVVAPILRSFNPQCSSHSRGGARSSSLVMLSGNDGAAAETNIGAYPYNDSDGKGQKVTIEHVFPALESAPTPASSGPQQQQGAPSPTSSARPQAPWQMGWQMNERNMYWNDDLKVRLIKRIAADELGLSESDMDERLQQLGALLPGLESRLGKAPPKLVARLAADPGRVAQRLLRLKTVFPQADLTVMVGHRLSLLLLGEEGGDPQLGAPGALEAAAERLRELLPGINVDRFVETLPLVLDVECFEVALQDARRIMPGTDVISMLRSNPDIILSLVKGKNLIPYDQISNPWS